MWHDAFAMHGPCGDMAFDPEFGQKNIIEQLSKIVDSESAREVVDPKKFKPVCSVITDDGDTIKVTPTEALVIRDAVLSVDVRERLDVIKDIQTTKGFTEILKQVKIL